MPLCTRPNNKFNSLPTQPKKKQKNPATAKEADQDCWAAEVGKVLFISRCERCTSLAADEFC